MEISQIGRYQVERLLGVGGFASVYKGVDPRLEAHIAIKILAENWCHVPDVRRRFINEAALLRKIQTKQPLAGVVDVFDLDEHDGRPFIVMSYADKGTLQQRQNEPYNLIELLPLLEFLKTTLGVLHRLNLVHRDIKPSNILVASQQDERHGQSKLLGAGERLVLSDFGLAKNLEEQNSSISVLAGTEGYLAPEQVDGLVVDHRVDIFSATKLVSNMLNTEATDSALAQVLAKGTAHNPFDRYQTIDEWFNAFTAIPEATVSASLPVTTNPRLTQTIPQVTAPISSATDLAHFPPPVAMPKKHTGRKVGLAAAAVFSLLLLAGGLLQLGRDLTRPGFSGPNTIRVGETELYTAQASPNSEVIWVDSNGDLHNQAGLEVTAKTPGVLKLALIVDGQQRDIEINVLEDQ